MQQLTSYVKVNSIYNVPQNVEKSISLLSELCSRIVSANIYLFKVNNRNTEKSVKCVKVCNKDTRMTSMTSSGFFFVNFDLFLVFLSLTFKDLAFKEISAGVVPY